MYKVFNNLGWPVVHPTNNFSDQAEAQRQADRMTTALTHPRYANTPEVQHLVSVGVTSYHVESING